MLVAIDGALAGLLAVADPVKESARDAIAALRGDGLRIVMLTGDGLGTAQAVARTIGGIDEVRAELKPEDKARIVGELRAAGARVAMAGDGINDAPALAAANVGIAMGTGTDVAIESADITLTKGDLAAMVPRAPARARDDGQHPPESVLLVRVQRHRRADRGGERSIPSREYCFRRCSRARRWRCRR